MVPLVRGPTPRVLVEKGPAWTKKYLADPNKRPDHRCYGHVEVRVELRRMSSHKCFYCERRLAEVEQEVDHYVEVAERPQDAFTWSNLYLSCGSCNGGKAPNATHPVTACVDPCASVPIPDAHLTFECERIEPRDGSMVGRATIRKYNLDRDDLDLMRSKALGELRDALIAIQQVMIREGRKEFSDAERSLLRLFGDPIRPFSLMMSIYLRRLGV